MNSQTDLSIKKPEAGSRNCARRFRVGQRLRWTPIWWRWDAERDVDVVKVYPRGQALLSNNVIVDADGFAQIYGNGRMVGRVQESLNASVE